MNNANQQSQSTTVNIDLGKPKVNHTELELFNKIDEVFQSPNICYYLSEYDFGNDYNNDVFEPLNNLYANYNNPNYHFITDELEKSNMRLKKGLEDFLHFKINETGQTNIGTYALNSWHNNEYTIDEHREKSREFNELASTLWKCYCDFNFVCRRILIQ